MTLLAQLSFLYIGSWWLFHHFGIDQGVFSNAFETSWHMKLGLYTLAMTHFTITAMSLSLHRHHTHKGVILNPVLDQFFQVWLWFVTSIGKRDWVSVHAYHHGTSDTERDPHSPVTKGFWHVLLLGTLDYANAKHWPEVEKLRPMIPLTRLERWIENHLWDGPVLLTTLNVCLFGFFWGSILSLINYLIAPVFAIGGVNTLAHWKGYRNHKTQDNSRNIGYLLPLNFLVCGELDHNNHHAKPESCSFRHRWFEFDFGYFYLKLLTRLKLAQMRRVYNPRTFRSELSEAILAYIERDSEVRKKLEALASQLNLSYHQLKNEVEAYFKLKRTQIPRDFSRQFRDAMWEIQRRFQAAQPASPA